jgi:hypothetical protein
MSQTWNEDEETPDPKALVSPLTPNANQASTFHSFFPCVER